MPPMDTERTSIITYFLISVAQIGDERGDNAPNKWKKIQKEYKINDFDGPRPNIQKYMNNIHKIENPGGSQKNTKNIYPQRASQLEK